MSITCCAQRARLRRRARAASSRPRRPPAPEAANGCFSALEEALISTYEKRAELSF